MEATRIIPISPARNSAGTQPSNIVRMEPDPGLIKMESYQGRESLSGGDAESAQRFAGEVKYVGYFAVKLAETLGMRTLEMAIVEDRQGQTAISAGQQPGNWHGVVSSNRRSIKQVRESLAR
ncbi:hypothetical protein [Prosthecobacter sp.]|uniref:hypothetical protein n=1 Tax=Prosthecobacter sp. TaxID=1965333 RepID=UPI002487FFE5|nr:hypothetical protein [Prosthecobacter sp.]MDI1311425.1 hypothetical protein [Prosthecobacter sp.]